VVLDEKNGQSCKKKKKKKIKERKEKKSVPFCSKNFMLIELEIKRS
jgi:hypothetical protein